ncbi:unnamed protein product [Medioppia subpectinata]|uniref:EGF-like domain-containing protein n=1 Tax=Medioppia subpectinata TaxID=1979941 RepID=A0A7R9KGM1_9ACAR|nr:unnamed protein product [Medioppia subpectinata]CAG2101981.1 unnamed protein product [Medioppia subpectinata]
MISKNLVMNLKLEPLILDLRSDITQPKCILQHMNSSPNSVYTIEISAWIGQEVGPSSQQFYKYTIDSTCKCGPNPECKVSDGVCVCPHGILGRYSCTQSTPCPLDCQNEGNCIYADNGKPRCVCKHGFQGQTCDMKSRIVWHEIGFNEKILHPCPYGSMNNMSASRICLLQPNGTAFWSTVDDNHCLEKIKMTTTTEPPMSTTSISVIDLLSRDIVRTVATDTIRSTQLLVAVDDFLTNDRETQQLNENIDLDFLTAKCVFWDELHQNWSTKGIQTEPNAKNKSITCLSSHLTAFSVLFDLTPYETREEDIVLSIVTSIGCYLSVCGLILTLITYTLFRFPEARNAWIQFFTSGTLKKYRGQRQRLHGSNGTNRMSASDKKPIDTESSFSMAYNSESKTSKPFLSPDESDVKHFTTYDSIRVSNDKPIDT